MFWKYNQCQSEVETTKHLLLPCRLYFLQRVALSNNLEKVDSSFLNLNVKDRVSFYYMVLSQQVRKVSITLFLEL